MVRLLLNAALVAFVAACAGDACREYGFEPGTREYGMCRLERDLQAKRNFTIFMASQPCFDCMPRDRVVYGR